MQSFQNELLQNYYFLLSQSNDLDGIRCGYDAQGYEWRGKKLAHLRRNGKISQEFEPKTVLLDKRNQALLGYIRESLDSTWLAHSCYYPAQMDGVEIYGFKSEFYAVRYLHEVMANFFPNIEYEPLPRLPWEDKKINLVKKKTVSLDFLNAEIGYIQVIDREIWLSRSFYRPITVVGLSNEFYATQYLLQVIKSYFPDLAL